MNTTLSHITALEIIRHWDSFRFIGNQGQAGVTRVPARTPTVGELSDLVERTSLLAGATLPLHVLVSTDSGRTHSPLATAHMALANYPPGSFFSPVPGVLCSSPELVALQMAEYATDLELLMLVDELCGHYGIQPLAKKGLVDRRVPLTRLDRIAAYLDSLGPVRGSRKLRRALERARELSGSPQESRSVHRLEFSPALGGYGLEVVALNDPVEVERADGLLAGTSKRIRKPDIMLLAPGSKDGEPTSFDAVALDYQGDYHRDPVQVEKDINRRNELLACDIKDYEVAKEHYGDVDYMDWLVSRIRNDLGLPEPHMSSASREAWRERRRDLCSQLDRADGLHWTARKAPLVMAGAHDFTGRSVAVRPLSRG